MKKLAIILTAVFCLPAQAGSFDINNLYAGGGIGFNSIDGADDATGFQAFAGYNFYEDKGPVTVSAEAGFMDSGDFDFTVNIPGVPSVTTSTDASGLWVSATALYSINESFSALGRLGYDFGDDDGALLGIGVEYDFKQQPFGLRGEYVMRDNIDSLQINFVYFFSK